MAYRDEVLLDAPVVYAEFNGNMNNSGTKGSLSGSTTYVAGVVNQAASGLNSNITGLATGDLGKYNNWSFDAVIRTTTPTQTIFRAATNPDYRPTVEIRNGYLYAQSFYGSTTHPTATGVTKIDDGEWHHIAVSVSGTNMSLYVDGVLDASTTASASNATNITFADVYYAFTGDIDEIASYPVAKSAAVWERHANAVPSPGLTVNAQPMTASADMPGGTGFGNRQSLTITHDADISDQNASTNYGSAQTMTTNKRPMFKFSPAQLSGSDVVSSQTLTLKHAVTQAFSTTFEIRRILADWDESTVTWSNQPATELVRTVNFSQSSNTPVVLDITGADIGYGVQVRDLSTSFLFYSSENTTEANRPTAQVLTAPQANASVTAEVATASASMPDAVISGAARYTAQALAASAIMPEAIGMVINNVGVAAEVLTATAEMSAVTVTVSDAVVAPAMTADALMPEAQAFVVANVEIAAEEMQGFADMPSSGFALPATAYADPMTASVEGVDAAVDTQIGVRFTAEPLKATATWKQPELVNAAPIVASETEDPYFVRIMAQRPYGWYRLNDKGSVVKDRIRGDLWNASYVGGVHVGRFDGPDNRHSVFFDGTGYIDASYEAGGDESLESRLGLGVLEFSIRTTKKNSFLLMNQDGLGGGTSDNERYAVVKDLTLKDGKISLRRWAADTSLGETNVDFNNRVHAEFTGFRNLADGEWHNIVVRTGQESGGIEIWVDGKLEIRRRGGAGNYIAWSFGMPDFVGGRVRYPSWGTDMGELPKSEWFVGDMTEIVARFDNSAHDIPRNYYAFMGWKPIEAESMDATADLTQETHARGNQKRLLYLRWFNGKEGYNVGGHNPNGNGQMVFDPIPYVASEYAGYKLFRKNVFTPDDGRGGYFDEVTDDRRVIHFEKDIDIRDYDAIIFGDWPDTGHENDWVNYTVPNGLEIMAKQLIEVNRKYGIGLFVNHPRMAVDLGIVDRVEFCEPLYDVHPSRDEKYDYGSAVVFPWNVSGRDGLDQHTYAPSNGQPMNTDPAYLVNKAKAFGDTHKNDRYRVRALVEGLTDIPSYMKEEAVFHADNGEWGWAGSAYKYLRRLNGLQIGDEFIFHGTNEGLTYQWVEATEINWARWFGYYATPIENVKAGTVVTTFGQKHWKGTQLLDNPYKDYATTIVLKPGDILGGKPVGGKIYVNFTEQPFAQPEHVTVQVLPEDPEDFPQGYTPDTPAQREWDYSWLRTSLRDTGERQTNPFVTVQNPDGSFTTVRADSGSTETLVMTRSSQVFPVRGVASWQMNRRGLEWLKDRPETNPGAVTVVADSIDATAEMPEPTVVAQRDVVVGSTPMRAIAQMPRVAESTIGDVEILTLPATAFAEFTGYGKTITVGPMTATAELVENFNMVHATGEQVVLTLHAVPLVTLYLKEEA